MQLYGISLQQAERLMRHKKPSMDALEDFTTFMGDL